jgi:pSer/pThr/pTyr-binding forkhead associated (FHA) protein
MSVPQLVVIAPDSDRGHRIELTGEYMTVGREPTCDVRLDDPQLSRTHAAPQSPRPGHWPPRAWH